MAPAQKYKKTKGGLFIFLISKYDYSRERHSDIDEIAMTKKYSL